MASTCPGPLLSCVLHHLRSSLSVSLCNNCNFHLCHPLTSASLRDSPSGWLRTGSSRRFSLKISEVKSGEKSDLPTLQFFGQKVTHFNSLLRAQVQPISLSALKTLFIFCGATNFPSFRSASGHKMKFNYLPLKCFYAWLIAIPGQHI